MKIKCIIVEDEPLALERTTEYVLKLSFLELRATFDNAVETLAFLKTENIHLIFLDINLGEMSGIQLLETSAVKSQVIFTTAYPEYALRGYDLKIADYLLKPFTFERFVQAVDRAIEQMPKKQTTASTATQAKFIFVKTENRLEKVFLKDILFIEGMRDYRRLHLASGKRIMTLQTFSEFERQISPRILCRVHKSYMVALDKIDSIEKNEIKIKNQPIPISETYKEKLFKLINHPTK